MVRIIVAAVFVLVLVLPAMAQDVKQPGDEFFDRVVLRGLADGEMKFRVGIDTRGAALDLFSLFVQKPFHPLDFSRRRPLSRQRGDLRLDEFAQLEDVRQRVLFFDEHFRQRRD